MLTGAQSHSVGDWSEIGRCRVGVGLELRPKLFGALIFLQKLILTTDHSCHDLQPKGLAKCSHQRDEDRYEPRIFSIEHEALISALEHCAAYFGALARGGPWAAVRPDRSARALSPDRYHRL